MFKFLFVILIIFKGSVGGAMENSSQCRIELEFSRSTSEIYNFVGFGDLFCDNNSPLTIFTSLKLSQDKKIDSQLKQFKMSIKDFSISTLSELFQKYRFANSKTGTILKFYGNENFSERTLEVLALHTEKKDQINPLQSAMEEGTIIIEQDQFFSDDDY